MIKQLKTLVLAIGLVAGMGLASTSFAAKPKEAAPAAAAPAARLPLPLQRLLHTKRILMAWALCGPKATWWPRAHC
ncbi:MAG: Biopolymer transport protein ExbB [Pseudomonadota bacterium]